MRLKGRAPPVFAVRSSFTVWNRLIYEAVSSIFESKGTALRPWSGTAKNVSRPAKAMPEPRPSECSR